MVCKDAAGGVDAAIAAINNIISTSTGRGPATEIAHALERSSREMGRALENSSGEMGRALERSSREMGRALENAASTLATSVVFAAIAMVIITFFIVLGK